MLDHWGFRFVLLIIFAGLFANACEAQELNDLEKLEEGWIEKVVSTNNSNRKNKGVRIFKTGEGVENRCQTWSGQGVAVRDRIMYRLYETGLCQTYDISDLTNPVKKSTFKLGSNQLSNHSNCAQTRIDENGDTLLYVSGLRGKCFVERITPFKSTLVQTISIPKMDLFGQSLSLNMICGDDAFLWLFGRGQNCFCIAKARLPHVNEGDVILREDDIFDFWTVDVGNPSQEVFQGGMVYNNLLFMLFGDINVRRHLAVFDVRDRTRILDIDLTDSIREEPEDCEWLPEGILIVTNNGSNYYLICPV